MSEETGEGEIDRAWGPPFDSPTTETSPPDAGQWPSLRETNLATILSPPCHHWTLQDRQCIWCSIHQDSVARRCQIQGKATWQRNTMSWEQWHRDERGRRREVAGSRNRWVKEGMNDSRSQKEGTSREKRKGEGREEMRKKESKRGGSWRRAKDVV